MAIYELQAEQIIQVPETTFGISRVKERSDLQRLLRAHIEVVAPGTLVIAEEFGQWEESKRRIDLLGLDKQANLVVVELKRTEDGGHMDLQAIRYAAMVSTMTFDQVVSTRTEFQRVNKIEGDAQQTILDFLEWDEPNEDQFAQAVRIVLVSADFSRELTTSVMWLNTHDLDIRCVRLKPYSLDGRVLVDVQQVIPLPEAAEFQVQVREKTQKVRQAKQGNVDFTRYDVCVGGVTHRNQWKRRAILEVARSLIASGTTPERVAEVVQLGSNRLWLWVEGTLGRDAFVERAAAETKNIGKSFDARRWFCDDEDLMHINGRTYALSNQWGGSWTNAMRQLCEAFPELGITFSPTEAEAQSEV